MTLTPDVTGTIAVTVLPQLYSDTAGPQTALFRGDMLGITESRKDGTEVTGMPR